MTEKKKTGHHDSANLRKRAEEALAQQNDALSKLNHFSIELSMLSSEDNLEVFITRRIKEFTGAVAATFSEYNPENRTLTPKHIELEPGLLEKVVNLLGKQVNKIHAVVSDEMYREMTKESIGMRRTLYEASFGVISHPVEATIQALLKADRFIGLAYLIEGKLYGSSLLAMSKDQPDLPKGILENFLFLATVSFRRKHAEDALKNNSQLLRDTGEMAKVGGWELDLSTKEVIWTEEVGRIHGVEPGYKLKLEEAMNFYAPESRPALEEALKKAAKTGEPYDLESLFIPLSSKDRIWVRSLGKAVYSGGKIVKLVGTFQNIDKYKRAEEALRESEARYRELFEAESDAIVLIDNATGNILEANSATVALYGYDHAELLTKRNTDLSAEPEETQRVTHGTPIISDQVVTIPLRLHRKKDGTVFPTEITGRFFIREGRSVHIVAIRDITERKQAEDALRESKDFAENLIASMQDGFSVLDSDGVHIDVNASLCQMTGFSREELIGVGSPHPYWPPEAYEEIEKGFQKTLRGEFNDVELTFMRKNGERFPVIVSPSWVKDKQGNVVSYFATVKDITERKGVEEALRESEERYRTVARMSSEFTYSCIHAGDDGYEVDWITDAFFTLTGYSDAELHEQRCWLFVSHPDDRETATKSLRELKAGESDTREFRIVTKGGRVLCIISHMECRADPKARGGLRIFGAVQDITERKRAEEEKRRLEERSRKIVEDIFRFIPEAVLVFSRKMELLRQNQAFRELVSGYAGRLGFSEDELGNFIIDKIKAGLGDNNIKEIRISRKHETGK
jgi:PAS domain S-box-containing protein